MHFPDSVRVRSAIGPSVLIGLLLTAAVGCGSSTVTRRVAIVDLDGQAQFNTQTITVTEGDTLSLTVGNRTDTAQDITVDGTGAERTVQPDEAVTVAIKAEAPGSYRVYSRSDQDLRPLTIVVPV
jgi:hypothetical protein